MMKKADDGLRNIFRKHLPEFEWTPVETGSTVQGVPDTFYAAKDGSAHGWIECKKTDGWAVKLDPHQVGWNVRHAALGVRCTVAIRGRGVGSGGGHGDSLWIACGSQARSLKDGGLNGGAALLGQWYGPPVGWDWRAIAEILRR